MQSTREIQAESAAPKVELPVAKRHVMIWVKIFLFVIILSIAGVFSWPFLLAWALLYFAMSLPVRNADLWAERLDVTIARANSESRVNSLASDAQVFITPLAILIAYALAVATHTVDSRWWYVIIIAVPSVSSLIEGPKITSMIITASHTLLWRYARAVMAIEGRRQVSEW